MLRQCLFCTLFLSTFFGARQAIADPVTLNIDTPMSPPSWALLERELLRANADACKAFFAKYFDERGFLLCVERWGGDDGPDLITADIDDGDLNVVADEDLLVSLSRKYEHRRLLPLRENVLAILAL